MDIKATDVKKLRDKTGAGMMDCKKALAEANGDFGRAEKILKELGLAAAAKRAGRATNEGRIFISLTDATAACLELSCETDFVAKNNDFQALGNALNEIIANKKPKEITKEMQELVAGTIGRIKENITIRRWKTIDATQSELFAEYIHGEGKIGVIVKLRVDKTELKNVASVKELAFNLALHIAAFAPLYLSDDKIDAAYIKEQEEIFWKQAQSTGKPENVLQGIAKGKLKKHFSEVCLLDHGFVKNEKLSVREVIEDTGKQVGGIITITDFSYYRVGEELEEQAALA